METIFAEATAPGKGGVSVVRLSGARAWQIAGELIGTLPQPRMAALRRIADGDDLIDTGVVLLFAEGNSFTGEKIAEFQVHGAPVIVDRLGAALRARGARLAQAGEFTRRAFVNGRLDLTQVQGLSDLLAAETEAQRRLAMRNANGELGRLAAGWRDDLTEAAGLLIAAIDFPDEDTGPGPEDEAMARIAAVRASLEQALKGADSAEIIRRGARVAIIGPPNAGKSTLMNWLARRDVAIVSETPGTTRDAIEVHLDLNGRAVTFVDTAGLRETSDRIEAEGVTRARREAEAADFRIHLSEAGLADPLLYRDGDIVLRSKLDLGDGGAAASGISVHTGVGLDDLVARIGARLSQMVAGAGLVAHRMQKERIVAALAALADAVVGEPEISAEAVRVAGGELESLLGRVNIDQQLDVIFSRFCIGK